MRIKFAKREASEYQSSLSSHDSCFDSIITQIGNMTCLGSSGRGKEAVVDLGWRTPSKNIGYFQKSYSMKKLDSCAEDSWKEDSNMGQKKNNSWQTQSQNSKPQKSHIHQIPTPSPHKNHLLHAKTLKFSQTLQQKPQKENDPIQINTKPFPPNPDIFSSDNENDEFMQVKQKRGKDKCRKVCRILYSCEQEEEQ